MREQDGMHAAVDWLADREAHLWGIAIAFFGIGDLATTTVGLSLERVIEVGPFTADAVRSHGFAAIVGLKSLALGVCACLWWYTPRPYNVGVALGLATLGVIVTAWNLLLLTLITIT